MIKYKSEAKKAAAARVLNAADGEKSEEKEKEKQQEELIMKSHCRTNTHTRQRPKRDRAPDRKRRSMNKKAERRSYGSARDLHVQNHHSG